MSNTLKLGNGKWATGKDTLLSFSDTNNNYKPLPFSFSRASSATVVNKDGLIETVGSGEPRIDFKDNTKGALKLEPQRSNLLVQSNNFNTSWTKTLSTVTSKEIAAPISGEMADSIIATATSGGHRVLQTPSTTGVGTFTMYIKQKELSRICVHFLGANKAAGFDCSDNTTFAATGIASYPTRYNISDFGNGWSKVEMYDVGITTRVDIYIANPTSGGNNAVWTGDGTSKIYFSAAQFEIGSYATSYIPTSGQANGVTRVADVCNNGGNAQVINSEEGVFYVEIEGFENDLSDRYISFSDGTQWNSIRIYYYSNGGTVFFRKNVNNVGVITAAVSSINQSELTKIAIRYNSTSFDIFSNGVKISTNLNSNTFALNTLTKINFSNENGVSLPFKGNVRDLRVYNTALTDAELTALTTI